MKNIYAFVGLVLVSIFLSGCVTDGPRRGYLTSGIMEIKPAPEVAGASQKMESNSTKYMFSAGGSFGKNEKAYAGKIANSLDSAKSCTKCNGPSKEEISKQYKNADLTYALQSNSFYVTFEMLIKQELFTYGFKLGVDNAAYIAAVWGINTENFEVGATLAWGSTSGEKRQRGDVVDCERGYSCGKYGLECEGYWKDYEKESFDEKVKSVYSTILAPGIYASVYYKGFSLNYTGSLYYPDNVFNGNHESFDTADGPEYSLKMKDESLPVVLTNRFNVGIPLTEKIRLRAGATQVFGDFEGWHWSGTAGLDLML